MLVPEVAGGWSKQLPFLVTPSCACAQRLVLSLCSGRGRLGSPTGTTGRRASGSRWQLSAPQLCSALVDAPASVLLRSALPLPDGWLCELTLSLSQLWPKLPHDAWPLAHTEQEKNQVSAFPLPGPSTCTKWLKARCSPQATHSGRQLGLPFSEGMVSAGPDGH